MSIKYQDNIKIAAEKKTGLISLELNSRKWGLTPSGRIWKAG
jgi:hypothetical protein